MPARRFHSEDCNRFKVSSLEKDTEDHGKSIWESSPRGDPPEYNHQICEGPDEEEMADAITTLFDNRFEEEVHVNLPVDRRM